MGIAIDVEQVWVGGGFRIVPGNPALRPEKWRGAHPDMGRALPGEQVPWDWAMFVRPVQIAAFRLVWRAGDRQK